MMMPSRQAVAAIALGVSGLALGGAWFAENILGLVPCALCLLERWPFRVVLAVSALALIWKLARRPLLALALLAMLAGVGLGATHVGVEQHWWPSPLPECAAPAFGGGSIADRLARMPARPAKPCDEAVLLIPSVPVSFAALQLVLALVMSVLLATSVLRME